MVSKLYKRALNLSYFTIIYNIIEGLLSIFAGLLAGSTSLLGFGLDSVVESFSATVLVWRFRKSGELSEDEVNKVEKRALKYIGYTFLILGIYILYDKHGMYCGAKETVMPLFPSLQALQP